MGGRVPQDRTIKQPAEGFCRNPECAEEDQHGVKREYHFPVHHDNFSCPKCGADRQPMIGILTLTHLLIPHEKGPIKGKEKRWVIACDSERAYLATATNNEAASDDVSVVTCPGCLERAEKLGIIKPAWSFQGNQE